MVDGLVLTWLSCYPLAGRGNKLNEERSDSDDKVELSVDNGVEVEAGSPGHVSLLSSGDGGRREREG